MTNELRDGENGDVFTNLFHLSLSIIGKIEEVVAKGGNRVKREVLLFLVFWSGRAWKELKEIVDVDKDSVHRRSSWDCPSSS